jgi:hypothetical protein
MLLYLTLSTKRTILIIINHRNIFTNPTDVFFHVGVDTRYSGSSTLVGPKRQNSDLIQEKIIQSLQKFRLGVFLYVWLPTLISAKSVNPSILKI